MTEPTFAAGDATAVVIASAWRCPRGHNAVYRDRDQFGFYWGCRVCGATDNGLNWAEPEQVVPRTGPRIRERLPQGGGDPSGWADVYAKRVEETTQELRARLKRYCGRFAGGTQRRQG